ncbi:peptide-methionine (S)-S-oxide reductase MsrA [Mangrovimonas aestuarii]|uniref:peptide-methionine (S)-S-oxide reductase MsrA n=1 Tax=Mangrovimonas aestuarii TaxID=3018443 RepID=UPI00237930B6|nr:peptide-methionine (S)-S-oxide reductase MsrA [Mangrovimonas aestuarii]
MNFRSSFLLSIILIWLFSCNNTAQVDPKQEVIKNAPPVEIPMQNGLARAYFSSGCFWCVEAVYESVYGVKEVISGYSGGHTKKPTYHDSNTGTTGHAESVEVIYDPKKVSFSTLVDIYFGSQDPTQVNGQGHDIGSQYRSIIFYQNEEQKQIILNKKKALSNQLNANIAAEVYPFQKFWKAEDYHQNYLKNHPTDPYVQNVSIPRLKRFKANFPNLLKENNK